MKKYLKLAMFLVLAVALVSPISVLAKTKAGVKSGSFFYFFDKTFEKANLFFTFSPEKKAKKALENAEERLAEAEESASENKPEAVTEAMENYQKNIEVLEKVLNKVPEEAKEAIEKAIEADKERQEEMTKKIAEINNEIKNEDNDLKKDEEEKANDDVGDSEDNEEENGNENKDENKKDEQKKEIEKLKKEVEILKQKQPQVKIIEKVVEKEKPIIIEKKESSSSQTNNQTKQNENIITLPNGAVVEMDARGNITRYITEPVQEKLNSEKERREKVEAQKLADEQKRQQEEYTRKLAEENLRKQQEEAKIKAEQELQRQSEIKHLIEEKEKQEEILMQQKSSISNSAPTLTYEQLHCPRFYKLQDSLGNTGETAQNTEDRTGIPGIGGSFVKGKVSDITLKVFAYDPDGDTLQYRLAVFADGFQSSGRYSWSANNEFNIKVLNSIGLGPHKWIYIDVSDGDLFNCAATNIDSNAYFSYTIYPE